MRRFFRPSSSLSPIFSFLLLDQSSCLLNSDLEFQSYCCGRHDLSDHWQGRFFFGFILNSFSDHNFMWIALKERSWRLWLIPLFFLQILASFCWATLFALEFRSCLWCEYIVIRTTCSVKEYGRVRAYAAWCLPRKSGFSLGRFSWPVGAVWQGNARILRRFWILCSSSCLHFKSSFSCFLHAHDPWSHLCWTAFCFNFKCC